jgi:Helix-turn-helix
MWRLLVLIEILKISHVWGMRRCGRAGRDTSSALCPAVAGRHWMERTCPRTREVFCARSGGVGINKPTSRSPERKMLRIVCRFKVFKRGRLGLWSSLVARRKVPDCASPPTCARHVRKEVFLRWKLAATAGLHCTYVGSIERGERNASMDNIGRLARALDLDVVQLLAP